MKHKFARRYQSALLAYLKQGPGARLHPAHGMGQQALTAGLQTLDVAKLHEQILITRVLPGRPANAPRSPGRRGLSLSRRSPRLRKFIAAHGRPLST